MAEELVEDSYSPGWRSSARHNWIRRALTPDRSSALRQYRVRSAVYDLQLALLEPVRTRAVERLRLRPGEIIVDVGCGTGLSFPLLQRGIGPSGLILGIEQSPEMLARARARVAQHGWKNVRLVRAPVETAEIPLVADAALFHFTHDIMRTPQALRNVLHHLRSGARVVASGLKYSALPLNMFVLFAAFRSTSTVEGLGRPWSHLARLVSKLEIEQLLGGSVYLARGIVDE